MSVATMSLEDAKSYRQLYPREAMNEKSMSFSHVANIRMWLMLNNEP